MRGKVELPPPGPQIAVLLSTFWLLGTKLTRCQLSKNSLRKMEAIFSSRIRNTAFSCFFQRLPFKVIVKKNAKQRPWLSHLKRTWRTARLQMCISRSTWCSVASTSSRPTCHHIASRLRSNSLIFFFLVYPAFSYRGIAPCKQLGQSLVSMTVDLGSSPLKRRNTKNKARLKQKNCEK